MSTDTKDPPRAGALQFDKSSQLLQLASTVIAGGVNSNVRLREQPHPLFIESADGAHVWDADGNELIDYALGNGPMLLGHRPRAVIAAVKAQLDVGLLYAGQHRLEAEVAEMIVEYVPCAELVRFSQTGTEALLFALRMARATTGRQKILKFQGHYHGWSDSLHFGVARPASASADGRSLATIPGSDGQQDVISQDVLVATWNDASGLEALVADHRHELAAIFAEPIMSNGCIPPAKGFLELVRELCTANGITLIFDEIITGFRFGLGGAQARLGVVPDLAVFGKSMASGFPVSAIVGQRELFSGIVNGSVLHAGTYNGSPVGLAATRATLETLADPSQGVYEHIEAVGSRLIDGLKRAADGSGVPVLIQGFPPFSFMGFTSEPVLTDHRSVETLNADQGREFMRQVVRRGIRPYSRPAWMISAAHSNDDIDRTVDVCADVLSRMQR